MAVTKDLFGTPLDVGQLRFSREGAKTPGLNFGKGTCYRVTGISGWGSFSLRDGDLKSSGVGGDLAGRSLINSRSLDLQIILLNGSESEALEFERTFRPSEVIESPLEFNTFTGGHRYIYARVMGISRTRNRNKRYHMYSVKMKARQPWMYSIQERIQTFGVTVASLSGFNLPIAELPLNFDSNLGEILIDNQGIYEAFPIWAFSGPDAGQSTETLIINDTTSTQIRYTGPLTAGQVVYFSTEAMITGNGRIITLGSHSTAPSVYQHWEHPHKPLLLAPGINKVRMSAAATSGTTGIVCQASWKDVWI